MTRGEALRELGDAQNAFAAAKGRWAERNAEIEEDPQLRRHRLEMEEASRRVQEARARYEEAKDEQ